MRERDQDPTSWLEHFTEGPRSQLMDIRVSGELAIKDSALMDKARKLMLNERQLTLLRHIIDHGHASVEELRETYDLVGRTVQRDLARMVELGLVEEVSSRPTDPTKVFRAG